MVHQGLVLLSLTVNSLDENKTPLSLLKLRHLPKVSKLEVTELGFEPCPSGMTPRKADASYLCLPRTHRVSSQKQVALETFPQSPAAVEAAGVAFLSLLSQGNVNHTDSPSSEEVF